MEEFKDKLQNLIDDAKHQYNKLVLVIGLEGTGKTTLLCKFSESKSCPLVNLNLELSRKMLELTKRQRSLKLPKLLREIVDTNGSDIILLDNIELLFDTSLQQDPLRLLQGISRNTVIVASWTGSLQGNKFVYASPEHIEYKKYSVNEIQILDMNLLNK